jgi:DNA-binding MarR family transcriptional regulator
LRILWEKDGLTQRELSERAGLMEPTTFSALKAMQQRGYISRRQLPDSRRKVYVFLTAKGRALRDKLVPLAEEVNHCALAGASAQKISHTRDVLLLMIENLAQDEKQLAAHYPMPSTRALAHSSDTTKKPKAGTLRKTPMSRTKRAQKVQK